VASIVSGGLARTSPLASLFPTVQFLERDPVHVSTRSPTPHRDPMLSGEAPFLTINAEMKQKEEKIYHQKPLKPFLRLDNF